MRRLFEYRCIAFDKLFNSLFSFINQGIVLYKYYMPLLVILYLLIQNYKIRADYVFFLLYGELGLTAYAHILSQVKAVMLENTVSRQSKYTRNSKKILGHNSAFRRSTRSSLIATTFNARKISVTYDGNEERQVLPEVEGYNPPLSLMTVASSTRLQLCLQLSLSPFRLTNGCSASYLLLTRFLGGSCVEAVDAPAETSL